MKIDKSAIAITKNLTDKQLNSTELASVLDGFIKSCEKRNTPISIELEDLFLNEDEDESWGFFCPGCLRLRHRSHSRDIVICSNYLQAW